MNAESKATTVSHYECGLRYPCLAQLEESWFVAAGKCSMNHSIVLVSLYIIKKVDPGKTCNDISSVIFFLSQYIFVFFKLALWDNVLVQEKKATFTLLLIQVEHSVF
jgi:hypothetical protein